MDVKPIAKNAPAEIDWSKPNVLEYIDREEGVALLINEITTQTEETFMGLCITNSTAAEKFIPGRMYPGQQKYSFRLYDGEVILSNPDSKLTV